jgi:hypothetical protein
MTATCMCWGITCGDGWYFLLDQLCDSIQSYIDNNKHLKIKQLEATQVKEKFGGLRFYHNNSNEKLDGMIMLAECMSYSICELCGSTDDTVKQTEKGWIHTLCESCRNKQK